MPSITDPFLRKDVQFLRLLNDYRVHGSIIVAYDFDNTIYDFHNNGHTFPKVINLLQECKELGFTMICFTSYKNEEVIRSYCASNSIPLDYLNESPVKDCSSSVKPYFNILLDDRAGLESAYRTLEDLINSLKEVDSGNS